MPDKVTIQDLGAWKRAGRPITMLTAYDYPLAQLLDASEIDVILVGDTVGMVVLGYESTTPVTMEEMLHHAKAVRRGVTRALLVGDMPFLSFRQSLNETVANAGRFVQEAGCEAVKVEWKVGIEDVVKAIINAGTPVMGHVGLTPQTAHAEGGFKVRGRDAAGAARILAQALALQEVGCFALVLECIPEPVAKEITERVSIPTIGIGAGRFCDGQVLVTHDVLGLFDRFKPKFAKRYADLSMMIKQAVGTYRDEVRTREFPGPEHGFSMAPDQIAKLKDELGSA